MFGFETIILTTENNILSSNHNLLNDTCSRTNYINIPKRIKTAYVPSLHFYSMYLKHQIHK